METQEPATELTETQLPEWIERSQRTALRRYRMGIVKPAATVGILALLALLGWLFWFHLPNPARWFVGSPSAVASSASRAGQWSMLGYGTNLNGYVADPERQPAGNLVWSVDLGPATRSAPLAAGDRLYVGGYFKAMALDAGTGETIWEVETPGPMDHALTVANNNLVHVGMTNHKMLALNKDTGEQVWEFKAHLPISASALVHDGAAYITSAGKIIYALDAQTGEQLWKHRSAATSRRHPRCATARCMPRTTKATCISLTPTTGGAGSGS